MGADLMNANTGSTVSDPTILIVDDLPANLKVLVNYLEVQGYKIVISSDGQSALKRAKYVIPDLILLDVIMPGIDGFETCRLLKTGMETREIPVIFMTALTDTVDKIKGFEAGAVDYITKPFQCDEILMRIKTHITMRSLQKQLKEANQNLEEKVAIRTSELNNANLALHSEINERKQMEKEIKESLKEKEILLQEIHHRVKNNMQVIISLLNMEKQYCSEAETRRLNDTINRIRLFGEIHRKLYQQEDMSRIDFFEHLKENLQELIVAYNINEKDIHLELDITHPYLDLGQAISCGLLMNELITNSLKHAFDDKGTIYISIEHNADGDLEKIVYDDSGKGMTTEIEGFGLKIVSALATQLNMSLQISKKETARFEFNRITTDQKIKQPSGDILYIEDEILIAMEKIAALKAAGYSVDESIITSGEKALNHIKQLTRKPALIFMDIKLAGKMDGIETAEEIRRDYPDVPIVFLSGYEDKEHQRKIAAIPQTCFLNKTCPPEEINKTINSYLT